MSSTMAVAYWIGAWGGWTLFAAVCLRPVWRPRPQPGPAAASRVGEGAFALLMLAGLFLFRWPGFFVPHWIDWDETQFIAGGLTLWHDPMPWRSMDGQTAGPLTYFALAPLKLLGSIDYAGARAVGCAFVFGALWFSYRALRRVWGEPAARMAILPAFSFFAFSSHSQFVHYSSEPLALLLLAIALEGIFAAMGREPGAPPPAGRWLLAGVALGAAPWAKLQAVPQGAGLLLAASLWAAQRREWTRRERWVAIASLLAGLWVVPLAFAALITAGGVWRDFWISYIAQNFFYAFHSAEIGDLINTSAGNWLQYLVGSSRAFGAFLIGSLAAALVLWWRGRRTPIRARWPLGVLLVFGVASLPAGLSPNHYLYYLLYLVLPPALIAGALAAERWNSGLAEPDEGGRRTRRGAVLGLLLCSLAPIVAIKLAIGNPYVKETRFTLRPEPDAVSRIVLAHTSPGDSLVVWGYWSEPHVLTQLRQGTARSNSWLELKYSPYQAYFRESYLADLRRNRPRVFLDAVGTNPGANAFFSRRQYAHETVPEMRDYIAENYEFVADVDEVRIYLRKN